MNQEQLKSYICELFCIDEVNGLIHNQIVKFKVQGFSYKDMGRALYYYYEVQKAAVKMQYGIGIIPTVMDAANIWFAQEHKRTVKQSEDIKAVQVHKIKVKNKKPQKPKKRGVNLEEL